MRITASIVTVGLVAQFASAAIVFNGTSFTENFDGLPITTPSPSPFSATIGVHVAVPGTTFTGTKAGGTGTGLMPFNADNGSGTAGGIYSYGTPATTERALGTLGSGTNIPAFGVAIRNNAPGALPAITVSFTQENWRTSSTTPNTVTAAWAVGTPLITDTSFLTASGFTPAPTLNLVGPTPVNPNGALNGNLSANQVARTATINFSPALPVGATVYVRWTDADEAGADAGLAIDNFTVIPEPATLAVIAGGAALALRRRK